MHALTICLLIAFQDPQPAHAADAEARTVAVEAATEALRNLAPRRAKLPAGQWQAAEARLGEEVTTFLAEPALPTWDQFARVIQTTWQTECPGACAVVCAAALVRFPPTAALHAQLGMSHWMLAENGTSTFDTRHHAGKAAAAFATSRALGATRPAYTFAWMARFCALDFAAALTDLDAVLAHPEFGDEVRDRQHGLRALTWLAAGRGTEALAAFAAAAAADEPRDDDHDVLYSRALAIAGRHDEALAAARAALKQHPDETHVALVADVLGAAGSFDEALAWLAANPSTRGKRSVEGFAALQRSRAALVYVLEQRGVRPGNLRERLTEVLGLQPKVGRLDGFHVQQGVGADAAAVDVSTLPHALGTWLCTQPTTAFTWANEALFAVCVEEAPHAGGDALALALVERLVPAEHWQAVIGADALSIARAAVAAQRCMPGAAGVLTVGKLLGL